jgi:thymidylate kinase
VIIFLEGPDGSGKSTLAKKMSEEYQWPLHVFSWPKNAEEQKNMFDMYVEFVRTHDNVIVDRCWYSEIIYGFSMRNETHISTEQMYELEQLVAAEGGGLVIHCTADPDVLFSRLDGRGDDYIKVEKGFVSNIKWSYDLLMHNTPHAIPVVRYIFDENLPDL